MVCATHRDLSALIAGGQFREDLYYRISEITVPIPPLRERAGDVVLVARALLNLFGREQGKSRLNLSADALRALESHRWPGNVRELENRIKRAVVMSESDQISARDLELDSDGTMEPQLNLRQVREHAERHAVQQAMGYADGNISRAADLLGITRPTLYALLNKYGIKV